MKLFKIFAVILSVMYTSASFAAIGDVFIKIVDANNKPIEGLVVETVNMKSHTVVKTDKDGVATFKTNSKWKESRCTKWRKYSEEYYADLRENPKTQKRPVKIRISDPVGKYKKMTSWMTWQKNTACTQNIILGEDSIKETFPRPETLKKLAFDSRTGKLKFYRFCTGEKKPATCYGDDNDVFSSSRTPGTMECKCIHKFKDVDTQPREAVLLAKEYMWKDIERNNDIQSASIQCKVTPIRSQSNNDFISCTSEDGKYAYDFEFDDLTEGTDNYVLTDTAMGLCELYGGKFSKFVGSIGICSKETQSATKTMCDKLRAATADFSWTTEYDTQHSACMFNFREADKNYSPKNKINGKTIDITKYENIDVRSLPALEFLIRQFVETSIGYKLDDFRCASGFRKYGSRHLLECNAYTNSRNYTVEFVFNDLNEWIETVSNAGEGGMSCIGTGGSFDGSKCVGLSREQCTELNEQLKHAGGTKWDSSIGQCVLNDAATVQKYQKIVDGVMTGITIAGTVVVIVGTAGAGAPVVAAAMIGGSMSIYGTLESKRVKGDIEDTVEEFKKLYTHCKSQKSQDEQGQCARSVLQSYFGYIDGYISKGVFDGQYGKSLDDIFNGLVELTEPERITQTELADYERQMKYATEQANYISSMKTVSAIGDCILVIAGGAAAVKKLQQQGISLTKEGIAVVNKATNVAQQGTKMQRFLARVYNLKHNLKPVAKLSKPVSNANTIASSVDTWITETGKIISKVKPNACWVAGVLTTCK